MSPAITDLFDYARSSARPGRSARAEEGPEWYSPGGGGEYRLQLRLVGHPPLVDGRQRIATSQATHLVDYRMLFKRANERRDATRSARSAGNGVERKTLLPTTDSSCQACREERSLAAPPSMRSPHADIRDIPPSSVVRKMSKRVRRWIFRVSKLQPNLRPRRTRSG